MAAVAALRAEHVARHALGVHADEHLLDAVDLALDEREMVLVVDLRAEPDRAELAMHGRKQDLGLALDQLLGAAPIRDQILDGAELQPMLPAELDEVGNPGHRPVVLHDLADHPGGREPGQACEIDGSLGLARALQRPAGTGAQREDVSGLHDVARAHPRVGATWIVRARSPAEMPVSIPSRASIETVNAVS